MDDFKKTETKILKFWKDNKIFQKSLEQRQKAKPFVFFEGPPTANGLPHIGHFLTRIYKDLYGRYKTMRGFYVLRRAGWDTHGLPVEIEIEKQLGLKNKKDIEAYGIARFNKRARESVWKYKAEWEKMTERMGFWIDMDHPYITYDPKYVESVWWVIAQIAKKKLLFQGHKVVPYCPRCGTPLSSHEVALGYKDITETSVYVKFKIKKQGSDFDKAYLVAWTTTPWTLPGNVALAVGEKITYAEVEKNGEHLIVARDLVKVLDLDVKVIREFPASQLIGLSYEPLFDIPALKSKTSYKVYPADFVTTQDGTGVVHTAVMYGEDDYELGKQVGLPTYHTVDHEGRFTHDVPELAGQNVKQAERGIIHYLKTKNLILKEEPYLHSYPFCWRCDTQLLYYAQNSWFIKMSSLRKQLVKNNSQINWVPGHLKEGRFGEFIKEAKDWALSRQRYWGTPLPIWRCINCDYHLTIGSLSELEKNRYRPKNTYYILRHGYSAKNLPGSGQVVSGRLETDKYDLTSRGIEDTKKIARSLKKSSVDLILSSPFLRTRHTAQIVSDYVGVKYKIDKRLKELDHGSACEGLTEPVCIPPGVKVDFDTKRGDGESWRDVKARIGSLLCELERKYEGKKILLVSHGDPIWILKGLATNMSEQELVVTYDKNYPKEGKIIKTYFANLPRNGEGDIDLHRPYVDQIILKCPKCKNKMKRIPELADVWFDSGSMPYAQWHYPFENKNLINRGGQYPADFIVEAIDQTRGWFYTLLAISTALGKGPPYKNVAVLGHILDEDGQKMSKSKGNVISPDEVMDKVGVDASRWYFYTVSDLGDSKICSFKDLENKLHAFIGTIQNTLRFLELYASDIMPAGSPAPETLFDQWLYEKLNNLVGEVTKELDDYDPTTAARRIEDFAINELSNWWVRRSRRRFQKPASQEELVYVASVLRYVLLELAKLLAPFMPFLAEDLHMELHKKVKPGALSVHLHDWPAFAKAAAKQAQNKLIEKMEEVRNFVTSGLAARKNKGLKVRQPLAGATLKRKEKFESGLEELIKEELNIKLITYNLEQTEEVVLDEHLTEELIREGYAREIIRQIQDMRKEAKYKLDEKVMGAWESEDQDIIATMQGFGKEIAADTLLEKFDRGHDLNLKFNIEKEFEIGVGKNVWLGVKSK